MRAKLAQRLAGMIEGGVLALVCAAPWAFGSTSAKYEFFLDVGLAGLALLWGLRILAEGKWTWRWCPVAACLGVMVIVAAFQTIPLPRGVLGILSPSTAKLYRELLPERPESLPGSGELAVPAGSTLTLDRGVTRRDAGRLLAVLLLFAMVRSNIDPARGLKRLSIAALGNGTLLAFFGLVQAFSSPAHLMFWSYTTEGAPFGPFVNRNHFAFYVNLCAGLAVGLLLSRIRTMEMSSRRGRKNQPASRMLLDPSAIGIMFATGMMMAGVLFSMSRGGFLALMGGLLFGLVFLATRSKGRSLGGWIVLVAPAIAMALVCWIGYAQIADRLSTLHSGEALREQRTSIWARALPVVRDFPLFGTGCGTYEFADMLHRIDGTDADTVVDHAHNDYLETLVEGGLVLFVPAILVLVFTFRSGLRAAARLAGTPTGGLATGGLISMATLAIHSFTDFNLHIPSCVILVVVLLGLLSGLGQSEEQPGFRGLVPLLAACLVVASGVLVSYEGWRALRIDEIRVRISVLDQSGDPARLDRKVALYEEAANLVPEDYVIHEDLAAAHLDAYDQKLYEMTRPDPAIPNSPPRQADPTSLGRSRTSHLIPALRSIQWSRDLSPARAMVHLEIADHLHDFATADSRESYLQRAKLLAPGDPDLWFRCGMYEFEDGHKDQAWASWRHSLTLSNQQLPRILDLSARQLGPREILGQVLPENPGRLMEAAALLPDSSTDGRRIFREAALASMAKPTSPDEFHLLATIDRSLGRGDEALAAYRSALAEDPLKHDWRFELAELSAERGQFEESRQELLFLVGLQPENSRARILLDTVNRKIAEGK